MLMIYCSNDMKLLIVLLAVGLVVAQGDNENTTSNAPTSSTEAAFETSMTPTPTEPTTDSSESTSFASSTTTKSTESTTESQATRCNGDRVLGEQGCEDLCHRVDKTDKSEIQTIYTQFVEGRTCEIREGWWIFAKTKPGICKFIVVRRGQREFKIGACVANKEE